MKPNLHPCALALIAALALAACNKAKETADNEQTSQETPSAEAPAEAASATAEQPAPPPAAPEPEKPVAAATPEPNYLAPEGVYFLTTAVSIETDAGLLGLRPGAQVTKQPDGSYKDAEGNTLQLQPNQITNDLRVARQAAGADRAAEIARAQAQQQAAAAAAARQAATPPPAGLTKAPKGSPPKTTVARPPATPRLMNPAEAAEAVRKGPLLDRQTGGLGGGAHSATKQQGGYIWKKDANGTWVRVRPVN